LCFCHACYDAGVCWALGDDHAFDDTHFGIGVHAFEKFFSFFLTSPSLLMQTYTESSERVLFGIARHWG
jgi:hypothetical protein